MSCIGDIHKKNWGLIEIEMSCEGNNDSQLPAWHVYNLRAKGNSSTTWEVSFFLLFPDKFKLNIPNEMMGKYRSGTTHMCFQLLY